MEELRVQLKRRIGPFSVGVWIIVIVAGVGIGLIARRKFFPAPQGGKEDTSGSVSQLSADDRQAFPDGRLGVTGAPNIVQLPPIVETMTVVERDETLVKEQEGVIRQLRDRERVLVSESETSVSLIASLTERVNSLLDRLKLSAPITTTTPITSPTGTQVTAPVVDDSNIPTSTGTRYVVRSGDTLTKIGVRFGVPWRVIFDANRAVIGSNPDLIIPGQVLVIPKAA